MYKEFAKDSFLITLSNISIKVGGIIVLAILTKNLGAYDYGIWIQLFVAMTFLGAMSRLGLEISASRFLSPLNDPKEISKGFFTIFFSVAMISLLCSILIVFTSNFFAQNFFHDFAISASIRLSAFLVFLFAMTELVLRYFRIYRKIKVFFSLSIFRTILELCLIYVVVFFGLGLFGVILALIFTSIVILAIGLSRILRDIKFNVIHFNILKNYLKFSLPLLPASVMFWIVLFSDRYIISYFCGASDVGIYSAAYRIGNLVAFSLFVIDALLLIATSKLFEQKKIEDVKKHFYYSLKFFLMTSIPVAVGISLLAAPVMKIVTSVEFLDGIKIIPFITIAALGYGLYQIFILIMFLNKNSIISLKLLLLCATVNVLLNILLVPRYGITGAAFSTFFSCAGLGVLTIAISRRFMKFDFELRFLIKILASSVIVSLIISYLNPIKIFDLLVVISLSIVAYFLSMLFFRAFTKQEMAFAKNLLLKKHI